MAGGFDPNNAYTAGQQAGGDTNFPTSAASSSPDDGLSGLSRALGSVPVAIRPATLEDVPASGYLNTGGTGTIIASMDDAILNFDKMSPASKVVVQQHLYDAGLYPDSYYGKSPARIVPGELNAGDRAAYRNAVEEAGRRTQYDPKTNTITRPVTIAQVITDRIKSRQKQGLGGGAGSGSGSGATRAPLATKLTNPTDIRATVLDSARKVFGHNPDEALVNSIIAGFQGWQKGEQSSDYNNAVNGGTTTAAPDLSTYAEQQVRASNPVEAQAHDAVGVYQNFLSIWDGRQ